VSTLLKGIDDILTSLVDDATCDERATGNEGCGQRIGHPDDDIREDIRNNDVEWAGRWLFGNMDIDSARHVVTLKIIERDLDGDGVIIGCDNACRSEEVCAKR
jgi:hypothetical protein